MITPLGALIRLYSLFPKVFLFSILVSVVFLPLNYGFGWLIDLIFPNDRGVVFSFSTNEKSLSEIAKELGQLLLYVIFFACLFYIYIGGLTCQHFSLQFFDKDLVYFRIVRGIDIQWLNGP